ncbi:hypothetical protein DSO57_1010499 [Entomophthora muscae]|uniref:Uncharacterized protein n=1 Tax=Entomophthora muscae TaxID=34485 RepID=A0ACC2T6X0_9FUNG|nr:hypothetical protein DSO57_1010499 [Entomophthora muscae]
MTFFTSVFIGSHTDLGTTPESQFLDSSWRHMIPGVWYTATPLSNNPPVQEETKVYGSSNQVPKPQVFCLLALAFLLCYLGVYFFLGRFNSLIGRYQLLGELFHLGMVSLPVGSLVTGLNPSAIIHHLGSLLPSGWVPDNVNLHAINKHKESPSARKDPQTNKQNNQSNNTHPQTGNNTAQANQVSTKDINKEGKAQGSAYASRPPLIHKTCTENRTWIQSP